jgi:hypothetical protein
MPGAILTEIQRFASQHVEQRKIGTAHAVEGDLLGLRLAEVLSLGDHWQRDWELMIFVEVHQRITFASDEVFSFAEWIESTADLANDAAAELSAYSGSMGSEEIA